MSFLKVQKKKKTHLREREQYDAERHSHAAFILGLLMYELIRLNILCRVIIFNWSLIKWKIQLFCLLICWIVDKNKEKKIKKNEQPQIWVGPA